MATLELTSALEAALKNVLQVHSVSKDTSGAVIDDTGRTGASERVLADSEIEAVEKDLSTGAVRISTLRFIKAVDSSFHVSDVVKGSKLKFGEFEVKKSEVG
jgi:hypothetical protein